MFPELQPLFALNALRTIDAHTLSKPTLARISESVEIFGIDQSQYRTGWGRALDLVYDRTASSLGEIDQLIRGSFS